MVAIEGWEIVLGRFRTEFARLSRRSVRLPVAIPGGLIWTPGPVQQGWTIVGEAGGLVCLRRSTRILRRCSRGLGLLALDRVEVASEILHLFVQGGDLAGDLLQPRRQHIELGLHLLRGFLNHVLQGLLHLIHLIQQKTSLCARFA